MNRYRVTFDDAKKTVEADTFSVDVGFVLFWLRNPTAKAYPQEVPIAAYSAVRSVELQP